MGYIDEIDGRCTGCNFHKVDMCDADMVASHCELYRNWCSNIINCERMNNNNQEQK